LLIYQVEKILHVLLVEDDPDDIDLFREALKDNSVPFSITVINRGDEVVPYLKECVVLPDIIVLDLNLPKVSGQLILKQIKTLEHLEKIPVLILTTSSSKSDFDVCMSAGANKFMTKPTSNEGFSEMTQALMAIA
jgi:chemotaxis family two-component system response regulator Rcp1